MTWLDDNWLAVYKELICKGAAWHVANPMLGMPTRRRHVAVGVHEWTT